MDTDKPRYRVWDYFTPEERQIAYDRYWAATKHVWGNWRCDEHNGYSSPFYCAIHFSERLRAMIHDTDWSEHSAWIHSIPPQVRGAFTKANRTLWTPESLAEAMGIALPEPS